MYETSLRVRRAVGGESSDLNWIVGRFDPFLRELIRFRLGRGRARAEDIDDVAASVWLVALPRLRDLQPRAGHLASVLAKFLATTATYQCNDLLRERFKHRRHQVAHPDVSTDGKLDDLAASITGVLTRIARDETWSCIHSAIERLSEDKRAILALRLLEGRGNQEIGELLGIRSNTVAARYRRGLSDLKAELERSAFDGILEMRGRPERGSL